MRQRLRSTSIGVQYHGFWDFALLPVILLILVLLAYGAQGMTNPYEVGTPIPISTDPAELPYYLLRTTLRMFTALFFSVIFSFTFALLVTRFKPAEKVLVPTLDILQSIPILGFLSITVTGFIALFPGSLLGVECASIFAIFTSQAWNMAFSAYQSFKTIPPELDEASRVFRQSAWQRFWRLEVPFSMPGMLWNMMMSMSGGWFFLVASEAITVANHDITLPGVGSYIAAAIDAKDLPAIGWAIVAMLFAIVLYDQLFFRPLVAWADRFRFEDQVSEITAKSWLWTVLGKTRWIKGVTLWLAQIFDGLIRHFTLSTDGTSRPTRSVVPEKHANRLWDALVLALMVYASWKLIVFVHTEVGLDELGHVILLAFYTLTRVCVLMAIAILVWMPIGIWIGLNPAIAARAQAVAQFLAAFPANLVFPIAVIGILHFDLDPDIWLSPLIIFGTQWYILFNVIAGASTIPADLRYASDNLGLKGVLKWRRYYVPAVFPSLVTGALTAMGGSWNASIVAEYVSWGDKTLTAAGLGEYIAHTTAEGDFPRIALGIGIMCIFVMFFNRFVWRKLYDLASRGLHF